MTESLKTHREVDLTRVIMVLVSRWYVIAASSLFCIIAAYIYLWFTPKTYTTTGSLKFEEQKPALSELSSPLTGQVSTLNIQSENFTIQSRHLLQKAIKRLNYPVSFYNSARIMRSDVYPLKPLQIDILNVDSTRSSLGLISFKRIDSQSFLLTWTENDEHREEKFRFNSRIQVGNSSFMIRNPAKRDLAISCAFQFNTSAELLERIKNGLRIREAVKSSNIVTLQQTDINPQFAADILNAILGAYQDYTQAQKRQSATQVIGFINEQLQHLSPEVKESEHSLENYKRNHRIMDISATAETALSKISDLESQLSIQKIQLIATEQLKAALNSEKRPAPLNLNLEGNIDPLLGSLVQSINTLINERNELLKIYQPSAQPITTINRQIQEIKAAALENINASQARIRTTIAYLSASIADTDLQVSALPTTEKNLLGLRRNFEINEKVYSYLSEKSLEAQVNRSAITPAADIIEHAEPDNRPVSPNPTVTFRTAALLGILSGIALIVFARVSNRRIYNKNYITDTTSIPILGAIRKSPVILNEKDVSFPFSLSQSRSTFAESVRNIRTNINFLATDKRSKVICVTSATAGEGKSFVALNLASTMTLINKKVILIDADLRRPKLHYIFAKFRSKGLSNYLINQCELTEIIQPISGQQLDFIGCGQIPPNPSELLHSERMSALIVDLKKDYDIILIDTAPAGLVSDTTPLLRCSDINLFVLRYGISMHSAASLPQYLATQYSLNNIFIILNAFEPNALHASIYKNTMDDMMQANEYNNSNSAYYMDELVAYKWWNLKHWFNLNK